MGKRIKQLSKWEEENDDSVINMAVGDARSYYGYCKGLTFKHPVIGYLRNDNTNTEIAVYRKFNLIQLFFLKFCFGLKFEKQ